MTDDQLYELTRELEQVEFELDEMYFEAQKIKLYVDDGLYADIYAGQRRRDELKALLATTQGGAE